MQESVKELLARVRDYDKHTSDDDINRLCDEIERLTWENEHLRQTVLFFSRHYDGPPDNMLCERERELFQEPEMIRAARAAGDE